MTTAPKLFSKRPKIKGSRGKGLTYETHVGRTIRDWITRGEIIGTLYEGQWFYFEDNNGYGYCQTDILLETNSFIFILECKLTYTSWAWQQLRRLYKPVVEKVFNKPSITIQVCKNIHYIPGGMIESLAQVMDNPKDGLLTWHFLGR